MATVSLEHAWAWGCPDCGQRNTARNEVTAITEGDLREGLRLDPWEKVPTEAMGEWYYAPDEVMCASCGSVFDAEDPGEEGRSDAE